MTLTTTQVNRMLVEISLGRTWEQRSEQVPTTEEAREAWEQIAVEVAEMTAKGIFIDVPGD